MVTVGHEPELHVPNGLTKRESFGLVTGSFLFRKNGNRSAENNFAALLDRSFFESTNLQLSLCRYLFRTYTGMQEYQQIYCSAIKADLWL